MSAERTRVGLLGGTFDPIHRGHVDIALACAAALALDEAWLLPARLPPHKPPPIASAFDRHAMVCLATSTHARVVPDARELGRVGPSWTIDTLEEIRRERPELELFLLIGADSLRDLPTWRRWNDIVSLASIVATARAGVDLDATVEGIAPLLQGGRLHVVRHEPPGWSSRAIRDRLHSGDSCEDALDPLVSNHIRKCGLYAPPSTARGGSPEILT
jgi:nicotinate-nucleotide adenylyltransferase